MQRTVENLQKTLGRGSKIEWEITDVGNRLRRAETYLENYLVKKDGRLEKVGLEQIIHDLKNALDSARLIESLADDQEVLDKPIMIKA